MATNSNQKKSTLFKVLIGVVIVGAIAGVVILWKTPKGETEGSGTGTTGSDS